MPTLHTSIFNYLMDNVYLQIHMQGLCGWFYITYQIPDYNKSNKDFQYWIVML